MKKRVLFVLDSLRCGGAEKSLVSLLPLLDYTKVDVTLMLLARGGVFEQYVPKQVKVISYTEPDNISSKLSQLWYSFRYRFNILFGIKEHVTETLWKCKSYTIPQSTEHYDVAISYQQGFPTYYVATKVVADRKFAWVNVDLLKAGYSISYNRSFYSFFDNIVAVSEAVYTDLIDKHVISNPDKLLTVYDILNVDLIRSMAKERLVESKQSGWTITTVGRMTDQKAYDLAVMAADELRRRGHTFSWTFVGDGSSRSEIEKLVAEHNLQDCIRLVGEQANPYPYMAACDIYVQTSRFEGFGLTVTEARILGKAEVCTNFPAAYNQIEDGVNGLICEMTPTDIANKIEMLMTDAKLKSLLEENVKNEVNSTALTESAKVRSLIEA